jgi:hypothetical protein
MDSLIDLFGCKETVGVFMSLDEGPYGEIDRHFDEARNVLRRKIAAREIDWKQLCAEISVDPKAAAELLNPSANQTPEAIDFLGRVAKWLGHQSVAAMAARQETRSDNWNGIKHLIGIFVDKLAGFSDGSPPVDWLTARKNFEIYMSKFFGPQAARSPAHRYRAVPPKTLIQMAIWFERFCKETGFSQ